MEDRHGSSGAKRIQHPIPGQTCKFLSVVPQVNADGVNTDPPAAPAPVAAPRPPQPSRSSGAPVSSNIVDLSDFGFVVPTPLTLDTSASVTPQQVTPPVSSTTRRVFESVQPGA